jgi:hypothetical protein
MAKHTPREQFDPKKIQKLNRTKAVNRMEREIDRSEGRDTRRSRDGGTNRRNWR